MRKMEYGEECGDGRRGRKRRKYAEGEELEDNDEMNTVVEEDDWGGGGGEEEQKDRE